MWTSCATYRAAAVFAVLCGCVPVYGQGDQQGFYEERTHNGFFERKAEGWFWYREEPEEEKPPELKPVTISAPPKMAVAKLPENTDTPTTPRPFSAAWVRENLPKYQEAAWNNPTVENLTAYLMVQRFAMDRSEQFAEVAELAVIGNPYLDEITRRPAATFASQKVDKRAGVNRQSLVGQIAEQAGVVFFYKDDCQMCELQAPIIRMIAQNAGFDVLPVSQSGNPLPGGIFQRHLVDDGQAERMGVMAYPAMFLLKPDGDFAALGQGMMSLTELNQRIIVAAVREGWISEEEYMTTRPYLNTNTSVSEKIADSIPEMANGTANDSESGFVPPVQLNKFMNRALNGGNVQ